jgi:hypothetical protein
LIYSSNDDIICIDSEDEIEIIPKNTSTSLKDVVDLSSDNDSDCQLADIVFNSEVIYDKHVIKTKPVSGTVSQLFSQLFIIKLYFHSNIVKETKTSNKNTRRTNT